MTLGGEDVMSDTVRSTMVGGGFSQTTGAGIYRAIWRHVWGDLSCDHRGGRHR